MLLSSAPDSAEAVAKPDLRLWPEKFTLSTPKIDKCFFKINATF